MPKVGIVISNYNGWQDTLVCLERISDHARNIAEEVLEQIA